MCLAAARAAAVHSSTRAAAACVCGHAAAIASCAYGTLLARRYWCSPGPSPASNKCGIACSKILYDAQANAKCAAKVWKSGGNNWGMWATATKFYCRMGCPCGV